jgi:hypothetical protein
MNSATDGSVTLDAMSAHYPPCFCLITQGSKSIAFGDDRLVYDAARFLVAAVDDDRGLPPGDKGGPMSLRVAYAMAGCRLPKPVTCSNA